MERMSDIDAAVALEVMGWPTDKPLVVAARDGYGAVAFRPSINIAHAWLVVEHMLELGYTVCVEGPCVDSSRWEVVFDSYALTGGVVRRASADTPQEAICRAALAVVRAAKRTACGGGGREP